MDNKPRVFGSILIVILAIIGLAWRAEGALLDRKIKRSRAKRGEIWWR